MIPKIIWQTHEWEYEQLPNNFNRCTQTWKNLNPEWEYRYHSAIDRSTTVRDFDKELYEYYMFADKVTQSDIWRYVVLYQYGGFYTDMDSFCIMPLNYSIEKFYDGKDIFCTKISYAENNDNEDFKSLSLESVNNSSIAAIPKSEILKLILENIKNYYKRFLILDLYNKIEAESGGFSRGSAKDLWLGTSAFQGVVLKNKNSVCFNYYGEIHSGAVKKDFKSDFIVDYYGDQVPYTELCKKMGWKDIT